MESSKTGYFKIYEFPTRTNTLPPSNKKNVSGAQKKMRSKKKKFCIVYMYIYFFLFGNQWGDKKTIRFFISSLISKKNGNKKTLRIPIHFSTINMFEYTCICIHIYIYIYMYRFIYTQCGNKNKKKSPQRKFLWRRLQVSLFLLWPSSEI